jgi:hypothetical protein
MGLFDFLFDEVAHKAAAKPPASGAAPVRHKTPTLNIVLDNTESGPTASWGEDGLDIRGIKQRFPANASTGGTVLEGVKFVGCFTASVTAQTPELLSLSFTEIDKALRKRLAAGATKPTPKPKR